MVSAGFDGTTGRSRHAGRRTHVLQLLRDAPRAVSVREVAATAGIAPATARYHLEAFVDAGLAERSTAPRRGPGRPEVVYCGTLPNQTHERAQGFRVLAAALTGVLAAQGRDGEHTAYRVGHDWAARVFLEPGGVGSPAAPGRGGSAPASVGEIVPSVAAKLDALWFAPEVEHPGGAPAAARGAAPGPGTVHGGPRPVYAAPDDDGADSGPDADAAVAMVVNNCPLGAPDGSFSSAACHLEAGFVDGLLTRLGAPDHRVARIVPKHPQTQRCTMLIAPRGAAGQATSGARGEGDDVHDVSPSAV